MKTTFSTLFILLVLLASFGHAHAHAHDDVEIKGFINVESHIDVAELPLDNNNGDALLSDNTLFTASTWGSAFTTEANVSVASKPVFAYSIRAPPASSFIS